jgi:hypothetical protein
MRNSAGPDDAPDTAPDQHVARHDGCLERVRIPSAVCEEIRAVEGQFLVAPGHEHGERVVADDAAYRVVLLAAAEDAERDCRPLQLAPAGVFPEAS